MLLLPLLTLGVAHGAAAQAPGYQQLNPRAVRAEYLAEVLERVNDLMADWGDSWAGDRPDELLDTYWEDAVLIPPNHVPLRGHEEMTAYFAEALPVQGHVEAFMLDFDASGTMAQVYGNYTLGIQQGEEAGVQKRGPMITVYLRRGRTWKIRSQAFLSGDR